MLKTLFTLLFLSGIIIFCSCQKEVAFIGDTVSPDTSANNDTTGLPLSDTYLPLTKGSSWIYIDSGFANSNDTITVLGEDSIINTIDYERVHIVSAIENNDAFYAIQSHNYYMYGEQDGTQVTMLTLNDTASVGNSWVYDMGLVNGVPGKGTGKVIEKDISYTVKGKEYSHVIHTNYVLSYNLLGIFIDVGIYDFYFAKGIGVIKIVSSLPGVFGGSVSINSKQELISYSIK